MDEERLAKAIDFARAATEKDAAGDYAAALDLYRKSLEHWKLLCKYQQNGLLREKLLAKADAYVSRAELLKSHLAAAGAGSRQPELPPLPAAADGENERPRRPGSRPPPPPPPPRLPTPSTPTKDLEECQRLRGAIEGCIIPPVVASGGGGGGWESVAGLDAAKETLHECVVLPARFPQLFSGDRRPWRGILLYGPPGTGKTHLARACAAESRATFFSVSSADLMSKWLGESEKLVRELFAMARERSPAVIFLDEVDALCSAAAGGESEAARRVRTQLQIQMEGAPAGGGTGTPAPAGNLLVLGATNHPWALDAAMRRRFERRLFVPLPDAPARRRVIDLSIARTEKEITEEQLDLVAAKTRGYSAADVAVLARDALYRPVRRCRAARHFARTAAGRWAPCAPDGPGATPMTLAEVPDGALAPPPLTFADFAAALETVRPSVTEAEIERYDRWAREHGEAKGGGA